MKTKVEILQETYDYYSNPRRRATSETGCEYITVDGRMCAVGRCCENPKLLDELGYGSIDTAEAPEEILDFLKPEYQGHEIGFWESLQDWHDTNGNFTETGISEQGEYRYKEMIQQYAN